MSKWRNSNLNLLHDYAQDHGEGREAGGPGEQGGQAPHRLPAVPGEVIPRLESQQH